MITFGKLDLDIPFSFQIQGYENGIVPLDDTLVAPLVGHKRILACWKEHAELMKDQKEFIQVQIYKGTGQRSIRMNIAVCESLEYLRNALARPEFRTSRKSTLRVVWSIDISARYGRVQ